MSCWMLLSPVIIAASCYDREQAYIVDWEKILDDAAVEPYSRGAAVLQANHGACIMARVCGLGEGKTHLVKISACGAILWSRALNVSLLLHGSPLVHAGDGGYLVAGMATDRRTICLIKTDAEGMELWSRNYGEGDALVSAVCLSGDGGFVVAAAKHNGAHANDFLVVRIDSGGEIVWSREYGSREEERPQFLVRSSDVGFYAGGFTEVFAKPRRWAGLLRKIDEKGIEQWSRVLTLGDSLRLWSALELRTGGLVAAGSVITKEAGTRGVALVCVDGAGKTVWSREFVDSRGSATVNDVLQTRDGGFVLAGRMWAHDRKAGSVMCLMKTNAEGERLWTTAVGPDGKESEASAIVETADGGILAVGSVSLPGLVATRLGAGNAHQCSTYLVKFLPVSRKVEIMPEDD